MKKILFLISVTLATSYFVPKANAQVPFNHTASNPTGAITNAGADTMTYTLTKGYSLISIQPAILKNTGTLAGKCLLQYSVNGTLYNSSDSVTLTAVADGATFPGPIWTKAIPAKYWRIITNGGTTMSVTTAAKLSTN